MAVAADARPLRDIGERAVSVVVEELIRRAEMGDEHVDESVVVEVAHGDTHAVTVRAQSGLLRNVGELGRARPIGIDDEVVVIEPSRAPSRLIIGLAERCALQNEDVRPPIVVVIEDRDAWANDLGEIVFAHHAVRMNEPDPDRVGDINEGRRLRELRVGGCSGVA